MAKPLNTKRLLKQCQAIGRKQAETAQPITVSSLPPPIEQKEVLPMAMTPVELEQYLTEFLQVGRAAQRRYEEAVSSEIYPNEAIQDILHAAEFAPSTLRDMDVVTVLNQLRVDRRESKKELEITSLFKQWADEHKKALDTLENTLGAIRKVLKWQPNAYYSLKTDILGQKGSIMQIDEEGKNNESEDI